MNLREELNDRQYDAATSTSKHLRIIAGAGTGKTRTLTYRLANQIYNGMNPKRMVAITFTNKAAKEMKDRVNSLLQKEDFEIKSQPTICTFHAFCYKFLKIEIEKIEGYTNSFQIADDADCSEIYKNIFKEMGKADDKVFCKDIIDKISSFKTQGLLPRDITSSDINRNDQFTFEELISVYSKYQHALMSQNLLDFDDLLILTFIIMENDEETRRRNQNKYDSFLIDEFQDTNNLQYELVKLFMRRDTSLAVVGDPDQTIYSWRGAENSIIKDRLQDDFYDLETIVLDKNYRSTQNILKTANKLISNNFDRMKKDLQSASGNIGSPVSYKSYTDQENEARGITNMIKSLHQNDAIEYSSIAIIYRSNYLSGLLEKQLTMAKIPYEIYGGLKFFERAEIKNALSYLRLAINRDDFSFRRILKAPSKFIGDVTLAKATLLQDDETSLFDVFKDKREILHLNKKTNSNLDIFYNAYFNFTKKLEEYSSSDELISAIKAYFDETKFLEYVKNEDVKRDEKLSFISSTSTSKIDNVNELIRMIEDYLSTDQVDDEGNLVLPSLEDFLINVSLQSDQDTIDDENKVRLMTGHVSKGLEFPIVFVTGLNQEVFPSRHAINSGLLSSIEEERRLLYVCMTRAKEKLFLSSFGGYSYVTSTDYSSSQFIKECGFERKKEEKRDFNSYLGSKKASNKISLDNTSSLLNMKRETIKKDTYKIGDKVVHTSFGIGIVKEVLPGDKILVTFDEPYGEKKLQVGFKAFRKYEGD